MANEEETQQVALEQEHAASMPKPKNKKKIIILGTCLGVILVAAIGFFVWHQQPAFCSTFCHDTMGSYVEGYENSNYLVNTHAESGVVCLDCHEPTLSEQIAELQIQLSGDYRVPLAKRDMGDEFCLRDGCHTRDDIVAAGNQYVTPKGDNINPHTISIVATNEARANPHVSEGADPLACATCHTTHRASKGIDYCFSTCHHVGSFESCADCH